MTGERLRLRTEEVLWREVGDEVIALSLGSSEYLAPNESARALWRMLGEGATLPELAAALEHEWGIDHEEATRDAGSFVAELRARDLIEAGDV